MADNLDVINDFSGGMNNQLSAEKLAPNQSGYLENTEYRDGVLRTRRGTRVLYNSVSGETLQGADIFTSPHLDTVPETILIAQGGKIYEAILPFDKNEKILPGTLETSQKVKFLQAFDFIYIFRGEGTTPWRWSGKKNDDIEVIPKPEVGDQMPDFSVCTYAYNRIFGITGRDTLLISDALSEAFSLVNRSISLGKGDGQTVTGLRPYGSGSIVAFKNRSVLIIPTANGVISNASDDLVITSLNSGVGCVAEGTIVNIGVDIWFLSADGIYSLVLNEENNIRLRDIPLSYPVQKLMNRINRKSVDKARAAHVDNYYILAVPLDDSTENNALVVVDLVNRTMAGLWRLRDSTGSLVDGSNDPIFEFREFVVASRRDRDFLLAFDKEGKVLELLTDHNTDFVFGKPRYVTFDGVDDYISAPTILTVGSLDTQVTGFIEMKIRSQTIDVNHSLISVSDGTVNNAISGFIQADNKISFVCAVGGAIQWAFNSGLTFAVSENVWTTLQIVQDGVAPKLYVDSVLQSIVFTDTTDTTVWFSGLSSPDTVHVGKRPNEVGPFNGDIEYFAFLNTVGRSSPVAYFSLHEGSGTSLTSSNSATIVGTLEGDPTWGNVINESEITADVELRPMISDKISKQQFITAEILLEHKNPKLSVDVIRANRTRKETRISDREYSSVEYDFHGKEDWDPSNVNEDHDDNGRKNYAPLSFPPSGVTVTSEGITLEYPVERNILVTSLDVGPRIQFRILNTQGNIGIKKVSLLSMDRGIHKNSEI